MQHIPGLQIAESCATQTPSGHWSGGVAILVPPGYVLKDSHELVKGKAVAALVADRTSFFYVVSVYLHPDRVRQDLTDLLRALERLNRVEARIILAGDFNRADVSLDYLLWTDALFPMTGSVLRGGILL